jgi:hypothetical protein
MSIDGTQLTLPKWLEPVRKDQYIYTSSIYARKRLCMFMNFNSIL